MLAAEVLAELQWQFYTLLLCKKNEVSFLILILCLRAYNCLSVILSLIPDVALCGWNMLYAWNSKKNCKMCCDWWFICYLLYTGSYLPFDTAKHSKRQ